jgi:hypothetical protein
MDGRQRAYLRYGESHKLIRRNLIFNLEIADSQTHSISTACKIATMKVSSYQRSESSECREGTSSPFITEDESMMTYYTDESVAKRQNKKLTYDTFIPMQSDESRSDRSHRDGQGASREGWRREGLSIDTHMPNQTQDVVLDDDVDVDVDASRDDTLSPGMMASEDIRNKRRQRLARMVTNNKTESTNMEATVDVHSPTKPTRRSTTPRVETPTSKRHTESPSMLSRQSRQSDRQIGAFEAYSSPPRMASPNHRHQGHYDQQDYDDYEGHDPFAQKQHTSPHIHLSEPNHEPEPRYEEGPITSGSRHRRQHTSPHIRSTDQNHEPEPRYEEGPISTSTRHRRQHTSPHIHPTEPNQEIEAPSPRHRQRTSPIKKRRPQRDSSGAYDMLLESPHYPRTQHQNHFLADEKPPRSLHQTQLLSSEEYPRTKDRAQFPPPAEPPRAHPPRTHEGHPREDDRAQTSMVLASRQPSGPRETHVQRNDPRYSGLTHPNMPQDYQYRIQSSHQMVMSGAPLAPYDRDDEIREPVYDENRLSPLFEERSYVSQGSKRVYANGGGGCQAFQCQSVITRIWSCGAMIDVDDSEPRHNRFEMFAEESVTAFSMGINDIKEKVAFGHSKPNNNPHLKLNEDMDNGNIQPVKHQERNESSRRFSFLSTAHDNNIAEAFEAFSDEVKNVKAKATEANNVFSEVMNRNFNLGSIPVDGTAIDFHSFGGDDDTEPSDGDYGMNETSQVTVHQQTREENTSVAPKTGIYASVVKSRNRREMLLKLQKERSKNGAGSTSPRETEEGANDTELLRQVYRSLHQSIHPEPKKLETFMDAIDVKETSSVVIEEIQETLDESQSREEKEEFRNDSFDSFHSFGPESGPEVQSLTNNETMSLSGMISMVENKPAIHQNPFDDNLSITKEESSENVAEAESGPVIEAEEESESGPAIEAEEEWEFGQGIEAEEESETEPENEAVQKPETETVWESPGSWDIDSVAESHEIGINFDVDVDAGGNVDVDGNDVDVDADANVNADANVDVDGNKIIDDGDRSSSDAEIEAELSQTLDDDTVELSETQFTDGIEGADYDGPTDAEILAELMGEADKKEEPDFVKSIFDDDEGDSESENDQAEADGESSEPTAHHKASIDSETMIKAETLPATSQLDRISEKESTEPVIKSVSVSSDKKSSVDEESPQLTMDQLKLRAFMIIVFLYVSGILGFVFERISDHYSNPTDVMDAAAGEGPLAASVMMDEIQDPINSAWTRELQGTLRENQYGGGN